MKGTRYARATIHRGSGSDEFSLDGFLSDAREEAPLMVGSRPGMQAGRMCGRRNMASATAPKRNRPESAGEGSARQSRI